MSEKTVLNAPETPIYPGSSQSRSAAGEHPSPWVDRGAPLPESYGETRIVLLPRDPRWMFTYWEITEQTAREIKQYHGEDIFLHAQATLRMHEVNENMDSIRWRDVAVAMDSQNWYLCADQEGGQWFVELGLKTADGKFILLAKSNLVRLPTGRVSDRLDEKWVSIKEEIEKVMEASGGGKVGMGSLELARMLSQRWEMISQISSWKSALSGKPLSAPDFIQKMQEKGFWLEADCELVLYGASEKDATVTVAGKPVELFPDGTFSLRFALPDGTVELPVRAVSGDKTEERWVKISVERRTEKPALSNQ